MKRDDGAYHLGPAGAGARAGDAVRGGAKPQCMFDEQLRWP